MAALLTVGGTVATVPAYFFINYNNYNGLSLFPDRCRNPGPMNEWAEWHCCFPFQQATPAGAGVDERRVPMNEWEVQEG